MYRALNNLRLWFVSILLTLSNTAYSAQELSITPINDASVRLFLDRDIGANKCHAEILSAQKRQIMALVVEGNSLNINVDEINRDLFKIEESTKLKTEFVTTLSDSKLKVVITQKETSMNAQLVKIVKSITVTLM